MNLREIIALINSSDFVEAIFSDREKSSFLLYKKIVARPILLKNATYLHLEKYSNNKVEHDNILYGGLDMPLRELFTCFRQLLLRVKTGEYHILKYGTKIKSTFKPQSFNSVLSHNTIKKYILNDGDNLPFLVEQGIMSNSFLVKANMHHKFRQINRYLEFVRDIIDELPKHKTINIIDFGCGKSYLTFALYHYLRNILMLDVNIHGLDLKQDVINDCNALAMKLGFKNLSFTIGDIADYHGNETIDMVISLHACDTATDYALFQAFKWNAKVIMAVPCCQHELNQQLSTDKLAPLLKYGLAKERIASLMTDSLRANILEAVGYKCQMVEFIDTEHTPKNILLRAVKSDAIKTWSEIDKFLEDFNLNPTLYKLLRNYNE